MRQCFFEAIPEAAHRSQVARVVGLFFDLLAQAAHVHVHRARGDVARFAPHRFQKLVPAVGAPGMRQEVLQQVELGGSQRNFAFSQEHAAGGAIQAEGTDRLAAGSASISSRRRCAFTRAISSRGLKGLVM